MPAQTLDQPQRLPLVQSIDTRGNSPFSSRGLPADAMLVNCFAERIKDGNGWQVEKRPGYGAPVLSAGGSYGQGMANFDGTIISVSNGDLYIDLANVGTLTGPTQPYPFWFCQVPNGGSGNYYVINNGNAAYYSTGGAPTLITDASFPTNIAGPLQYLDGTTYVMDVYANIYNSASLNDPVVWTPQSLLSALGNGDRGVYLAKQLSYIIALKSRSFLVYYDAANATGSPLGIYQGASQSIGCVSPYTVQEFDDDIYWLATNQIGTLWINRLRNLVAQKVSTPQVDRILSNFSGTYKNEFYSWVMRMSGHRFYGLTNVQINLTLVYDIDQDLWYIWTDENGNYWPATAVSWGVNSTVVYATALVQNAGSGDIYPLDIDFVYPSDNGSVPPVHIVTPNFDGGIDRTKQLNILRLTTDQTPGNQLQVRWSDDDFQSWSPYMAMDLSIDRPILSDLGTFYRRAFDFYHNLPKPFRARAVDLQLDIGVS